MGILEVAKFIVEWQEMYYKEAATKYDTRQSY
jgi:hypothetical protein